MPRPQRLLPALRAALTGLGVACLVLGGGMILMVSLLGPELFKFWRLVAGIGLCVVGGLVMLGSGRFVPNRARAGKAQVRSPRDSERRQTILLLASVFLNFGALGPLRLLVVSDSSFGPGDLPGFADGLLALTLSGIIACGWAATFMLRKWWLLPPTILFQLFAPVPAFSVLADLGLAGLDFGWGPRAVRGMLGYQAVTCIVLGFVQVIRYVRASETQRAHADAELAVAREVHESLVPEVNLRLDARPSGPVVSVLGRSLASTEMGGDLLDVIRPDGEAPAHTDILLADVAGHGVGAGIVMAMLKSSARTLARHGHDLPGMLAGLNQVLAQVGRPGMFATAAVLRVHTGETGGGHPSDHPGGVPCTFALAGHLPILRHSASLGRVDELANEALPLGVLAEEVFPAGRIHARPGDTFLMLTDGLTEVLGAGGRQLGLAPLTAAFAAAAARGDTLEETAAALIALARAHGRQSDDQTLVLVRIE